ncbi:glycosyltransferase [Gillisia xinjiangensis]|uniref:glycosyltransferase n=1 Tax=Gillisia xinjiangensis TaxID=3384765 RepID=UPI00391966CB
MRLAQKGKTYLIGPTESILTKRGNRFPNIAQFLTDEGEEVIYFTSNFYHAEKRFFKLEEIDFEKEQIEYKLKVLKVLGYYNNVSIRRVLNNLFFSIYVFSLLLFKVKRNDKILLPSRPVELIYFISLLKKIKGVRIILDIQDIWPDALDIKNKRKKRIFEIYCHAFLSPSLKNYDKAFYTAPTFKKWLKRYSINTPSVLIPLGWEDARWEDITKAELVNNFYKIKLVCVAQLQHQINVLPILEVLRNNKNYHFTIIGEDGKGARYEEVTSFIKKNEIDNVEIIGKVDRDKMKSYLEDKDIGILPMITPSIPNKIFDYLASYLPIIVLGDNDSSEFVLENQIGWSCGFNSKELSIKLLDISEEEIRIKRKTVETIREKYSRNHLHQLIKEHL